MWLDEASGRNAGVAALVRSILRDQPAIAAADSVADPYMEQGSHPDAIERLWDELGAGLPSDCRCLVYGTPALVHPSSGVVLAFSLGTAYFVRRPASIDETGIPGPGWQDRAVRDLGADWSPGRWSLDEPDWCRSTYEEFEREVRGAEGA